ncbi:hypothetical protein [Marinobacter sp. ANT_B65]|uniref:hypothetical protein n=1 Tax=Marinobacter sp. ANT_B65 TaxID=2039467 RepID=UPI000BBEF0E8|nr:hypothetical protein [Marinobacter sp. ANT_B65]PCM44029.1 hypothetical protein CPA50_10885 [Marinobacter sp. ANT_B65]
MKIRMSCLAAMVSALALTLATPVLAHLMVAGHGTLNIVDNGAFMVLSLPLSAFEGIDDNGDGEIDLSEFNRHQSAVIQTLSQHVVLRDREQTLPLEDILVSPGGSHDGHGHHHDHINEVIVMGRFALDNARPPLSFHVDLFGKPESSRILHITASQKSESLHHEFQLTPEQPVGLLFPSEGRN